MISPLDKRRLVRRIEALMQQSTYDWDGGDRTSFNSQLPDSRVLDRRRKLPSPERVREEDFSVQEYRDANQRCLRMEGLVRDNRPGSVKRVIRDMQRGRFPFGRR